MDICKNKSSEGYDALKRNTPDLQMQDFLKLHNHKPKILNPQTWNVIRGIMKSINFVSVMNKFIVICIV